MNTKIRKNGAKLGALLLSLCLMIGLLPMTAFANGEAYPTKAYVKAIFSDAVETTGADSRICAATVKDESGDFVLHYVYSSDSIWNIQLFDKLRDGLAEPYKSLIPELEKDDIEFDKKGFLFLSDNQYENMELDWADPSAVAEALVPGGGTVATGENTSSVFSGASTDIIDDYCSDYDEKSVKFLNETGETITRPTGANTIEAIDSVAKGGPYYIVEDGIMKECNDVVIFMYVAQISACTATKTASESSSIDLPVRVLEDEESGYVSRPDLTATFTPDSAVIAGEFNEYQGLAIDYYYPMIDAQLSEGYDIQAEYTVSVPLTDYEGDTLSGTLTIPLPDGYDGATARIKGGVSAGSYTATTVSFPVTLDMEFGTTASLNITIEYKEAQEPVVPDAPVIINGANGTWQKGGTDGLSFTSNAAFADFIKVQVDGKDLDASDYTVKEGSTIVTLNADYLNTLSVGKHTLSIVSANGTATTEFTVTEAQTDGDQTGENQTGGDSTQQEPDKNNGAAASPQTGDSSNMMMWIVLMAVSVSVILSIVHFNRKKMVQK